MPLLALGFSPALPPKKKIEQSFLEFCREKISQHSWLCEGLIALRDQKILLSILA